MSGRAAAPLSLLALWLAACTGASIAGGGASPPQAADECAVDEDCDDQDACDGAETCDGGRCVAGWPVACDDGDDCTDDACDQATGACASTPIPDCAAAPCSPGDEVDDGTACNGTERCGEDGATEPGTPVRCDDGDPCTADECMEPTGNCLSTPVAGCEPDAAGDPAEPPPREDCDDDRDDDGDGDVDCDDLDCGEKPECAPDGPAPEEGAPDTELCGDRVDNDGDLAIDCYDRDCLDDPSC